MNIQSIKRKGMNERMNEKKKLNIEEIKKMDEVYFFPFQI